MQSSRLGSDKPQFCNPARSQTPDLLHSKPSLYLFDHRVWGGSLRKRANNLTNNRWRPGHRLPTFTLGGPEDAAGGDPVRLDAGGQRKDHFQTPWVDDVDLRVVAITHKPDITTVHQLVCLGETRETWGHGTIHTGPGQAGQS